ncbi:hypothetical protein SAMD00019534_110370, partial [Acytostelium subglobosum LB1]|uniref:hypothetical protein n=1 Tax=Acytostelium subglobosum LB1 TaxID=1410327 RepID=UPI000644C1CF
LGDVLSRSTFGTVYKGVVRGQNVAIKRYPIKSVDHNVDEQTIVDGFLREAHMLSQVRCPNILLFMGYSRNTDSLFIITELMTSGSVRDVVRRDPRAIDVHRALAIARDIAVALSWMHTQTTPLLHLNIKPANILVNRDLTAAKISSFRTSKQKPVDVASDGLLTGQAGSIPYMAPEMLLNQRYNEKCDVYSWAITLWEMATGKEAFGGMFNTLPEMHAAVAGKGVRPPLLEWFPFSLKDLLSSCWAHDPSQRPSFRQIIDEHRLEQVMVDHVLHHDVIARQFWSNNFLGRRDVSWDTFLHTFSIYFHFSVRDPSPAITQLIHCLKLVMVPGERVSIEQFGRFVAWFGPLAVGKGSVILERMWNTCCWTDGFQGDMATGEAINAKLLHTPGNYLIRFSTSALGHFAVSYINKNKQVNHVKVEYAFDKGFQFSDERVFHPSLAKLVATKKSMFKYPIIESNFNIIKNTSYLQQSNGPAVYCDVPIHKK